MNMALRPSAVRGLCGQIGFCLTLAGLLLGTSPSGAKTQPRPEGWNDRSSDVQPLDRLLPAIRHSHPGEFSDAHGPTSGQSGDSYYHLKWITPDGRVFWFEADARNGQVLRTSPGRDRFDDN